MASSPLDRPEVAAIFIALGDDERLVQAIASLPAIPLEIVVVINGALEAGGSDAPSSFGADRIARSAEAGDSASTGIEGSPAPCGSLQSVGTRSFEGDNEGAGRGTTPPLAAASDAKSAEMAGRRLSVFLRRAANPGFAAAFNEALARTEAPYVLSLNPDATLEPKALEAALAALKGDPALGAIALRLLRPDRKTMDSAGIRLGPLRLAKDRGMGEPAAGRFERAEDVDAACGAAALFRRSALEAVADAHGVMDERFFAYKEDVDLGWRLRRAGYRIRYCPAALARHERGWKERSRARVPSWLRVLSLKNRWLMILKNERGFLGPLRILGLLLFIEPAVALRLLLTEPRTLLAYPAVLAALFGRKEEPKASRRR